MKLQSKQSIYATNVLRGTGFSWRARGVSSYPGPPCGKVYIHNMAESVYCVSKKSCPLFIVCSSYKIGQDFLDIQHEVPMRLKIYLFLSLVRQHGSLITWLNNYLCTRVYENSTYENQKSDPFRAFHKNLGLNNTNSRSTFYMISLINLSALIIKNQLFQDLLWQQPSGYRSNCYST